MPTQEKKRFKILGKKEKLVVKHTIEKAIITNY